MSKNAVACTRCKPLSRLGGLLSAGDNRPQTDTDGTYGEERQRQQLTAPVHGTLNLVHR